METPRDVATQSSPLAILKPTILISRLVVQAGNAFAYDERFHRGLNIIRGENSSGKSTIVAFLVFALGGELKKLPTPEMLSCDFVFVEAALNGASVSLRREVSEERDRPMSIYWGSLEEAFANQPGWQHFPYATRGDKVSFSQQILDALEMPSDAKDEDHSRMNMNQLLRLIHADQLTSSNALFVAEQFDSPIKRRAIADYLMGVFSEELYTLQQTLQALNSRKASLTASRDEMLALFKELNDGNLFAALHQERETILASLQTIEQSISLIRDSKLEVGDTESERNRRNDIGLARKELGKIRERLSSQEERKETLSWEICDFQLFIKTLESHVASIDEADVTRNALLPLKWHLCPACGSSLPEQVDESVCPLCKNGTEGNDKAKLLRHKQALIMQIRESGALLKERMETLGAITAELEQLRTQERQVSRNMNKLAREVRTAYERETESIYEKKGYLERQLEDIDSRSLIAHKYANIKMEILAVTREAEVAKARIAELESELAGKKEAARTSIGNKAAEILRADLEREEAFIAASYVDVNFAADRAAVVWKDSSSIDGTGIKQGLSASSTAILRSAIHLAFWSASLEHDFFRFPRLLILDSTFEDKGMEAERSKNFQRIVARFCREALVENQVVLTTSNVAEDLEKPEYTVGEHYTPGNKSLNFSQAPKQIKSDARIESGLDEFETDESEESLWETAARDAVVRALEGADWDSDKKVVTVYDELDDIVSECDSFDSLLQELSLIADTEGKARMPIDSEGELEWHIDSDGIAYEELDKRRGQLEEFGWEF